MWRTFYSTLSPLPGLRGVDPLLGTMGGGDWVGHLTSLTDNMGNAVAVAFLAVIQRVPLVSEVFVKLVDSCEMRVFVPGSITGLGSRNTTPSLHCLMCHRHPATGMIQTRTLENPYRVQIRTRFARIF